MPIGPLMLDLEGLALTKVERTNLAAPEVGGVILFSRNYASPQQLNELTRQIRVIREELIIAVDQEGGRVQRFREAFTRIPPMGVLGKLYHSSPARATEAAQQFGWLIAAELLVHDIDLSFAPVLDVGSQISQVIGDRAFSSDPSIISRLGRAFIQGFHDAGMAATGKHFPGHGSVAADSHIDIPVDQRSFAELEANDLLPFQCLAGELDAVMPAHVIYEKIDKQPAGFSQVWIQQILRKQLKFDGVVFSDDLSMEGAAVAGTYAERAAAALAAGCDMVLVCNNPGGAEEVLAHLRDQNYIASHRLAKLKRSRSIGNPQLTRNERWLAATTLVSELTA